MKSVGGLTDLESLFLLLHENHQRPPFLGIFSFMMLSTDAWRQAIVHIQLKTDWKCNQGWTQWDKQQSHRDDLNEWMNEAQWDWILWNDSQKKSETRWSSMQSAGGIHRGRGVQGILVED